MKRLWSSVAPIAASNEVYQYLLKDRPHRWGFLGLSAAITGFICWGLIHDSYAEVPYKREIIYVQDWRLDRSDAEIIAQQKIDQAAKDKRDAAQKAKDEKVRKQYQDMLDAMKRWGL